MSERKAPTARPLTRAARKRLAKEQENAKAEADGNKNDADRNGTDDELEDIDAELIAIAQALKQLSTADRKLVDGFVVVEAGIIAELKEKTKSWEWINRMSVPRMVQWATKNCRAAVGLMAQKGRKADKVDILEAALKAKRKELRAEYAELLAHYVELGIDEGVLRGARLVLENGGIDAVLNTDTSGKKKKKNIDPDWTPLNDSGDDDDDHDNDILHMPHRFSGRGNTRKKGKNGKVGFIIPGKDNKDNGNGNENVNENENVNLNLNEDDNKNDNIFADIPATFKRGLDKYIKQAWEEHAAAAGLQGTAAPAGIKPGGGANNANLKSPGDKRTRVPIDPKKDLTKKQLKARQDVKAELGKLPRKREVC